VSVGFGPFWLEDEIGLPIRATTRAFIWPTESRRVTSEFGHRRHPVTGVWGGHRGIDIGIPIGTNVYAATAGIVTQSFYSRTERHADGRVTGGGGHMIVILSPEGMRTRYLHLNCRSLVSVGDEVVQGQHIAFSGNTGLSTAPHLHFDISTQVNGEWIFHDPRDHLPS